MYENQIIPQKRVRRNFLVKASRQIKKEILNQDEKLTEVLSPKHHRGKDLDGDPPETT